MELKIGDIAEITGVPEREIRVLVQTYEDLFSYRTIGPVRIFPERAVQIVREIIDLSGEGLTTDEIIEAVHSGGAPTSPREPEADRPAPSLPPGVAFDLRMMQETLARQERRIAHLTAELEREREEVDRLRQAIDDLQEQFAIVAEWVDYFDLQMDEATLPALERIRRALLGRGGPGRGV